MSVVRLKCNVLATPAWRGGQSSPTWRQTAAPPTLRYRVCISTLCVCICLYCVVSRQEQSLLYADDLAKVK